MNHAIEHVNLVASFPPSIPKNSALIQLIADDGHTISAACRLDSSKRKTITMGRDLDCDIVLDDPFVAARHCQLQFDAAGQLHVMDLGSVNGILLDGQRVARAMIDNGANALLTMGQSSLRVRLKNTRLEPERPLSTQQIPDQTPATRATSPYRIPAWQFWTVTVLFALLCGAEKWFGSFDHERIAFEIAASILTALAIVAIWTAGWALISRLVIGSPQWRTHACIAMAGYLLTWSGYNMAGASAFALSMVPSWTVTTIVVIVAMSFALLYGHLKVATRLGNYKAMACAAILPTIILGLSVAKLSSTEQGLEGTEISSIYLLPPAARIQAPVDVSALLKDARDLKTLTLGD